MSSTRRPLIPLVVILLSLGLLTGCPQAPTSTPTTATTASHSATIGLEGGTVSIDGGPSIEIPPGALTSGPVNISLGTSDAQPGLPAGLTLVGDVWDIGPAGTAFTTPARVTLPIPKGLDPGDVLGVFTLEPSTGSWVSVSSSIDLKASSVSAAVDHLSPFGIYGGRAEAAKTGGWIQVVNSYARGSLSFPGGQGLPMHRENLVCFTAYNPTNPGLLVSPSWDVVVATPYWGPTADPRPTVAEFWLPAGNYTVEQGIFASEINNNPTYTPQMLWWTRSPQALAITPGRTVRFQNFPAVPPAASTGFVKRPNSCAVKWSARKPTATPTTSHSPTPTRLPPELPADWTFVCAGSPNLFKLDTLTKNDDGTFTGTGHLVSNPSYTWDLSGRTSDDQVSWSVTYTGSEAGFVYSGTGTIAADGSLHSDVDANVNKCTEVYTSGGIFP